MGAMSSDADGTTDILAKKGLWIAVGVAILGIVGFVLPVPRSLVDTMVQYGRRFRSPCRLHVSLSDVLEAFGLEDHKSVISGKDVPTLHAQGETGTIVRYALLDVLAEAAVFERMTGTAAGLR